MKKNKLFLLPLVACGLFMSACSSELDVSNNPNRAGAGEAILSVSLQFPQAEKPAGYAAGDLGEDVLPGVALDAEKEIRSIAFIAFTTGSTGVYLSTNPTFDEQGFTEPLTSAASMPAGNYKASFKIKSGDFSGESTIVAVANFAEHGLTFDPKNLSIASLESMLTTALNNDESIAYPLLMTVANELSITEGSTIPMDFKMERIMARIDVVNNAYDKATPANNFVLTSARLLSASAQGTMIGGQTITTPAYVDMAEQTTVTEKDPATQQLAPLYAYENSNTKADGVTLSDNATSVEVKGVYKGKAYTKVIPFKTREEIVNNQKVGGEIVPIARNYRYVVAITSSKEEELTFDLEVTDWIEGKQLEVELEFAAPKLEGLDGFSAPAGATWDAATKTLNITNANANAEIEFAVRGFQDSDFDFEAEYDENVDKLAKTITIDRGELSGYADAADEKAPLTRTYKVSIPPYTGEYPSLTKIIVYNAAYPDAQTEITVKYAPVFVADLKATQSGAVIDQDRRLISLNKAPSTASTFTFFASCNVDVNATVDSKNTTAGFYTFTKSADETDAQLIAKYGPGKRVTMSYKALTNTPQLGEVSVFEKDAAPTTGVKMYVKCFRKPYFASYKFAPNADNALAEGDMLYLAVNNGDHGTIDYTVYDDVVNNAVTLASTATYTTTATSPAWATTGLSVANGGILETVSESFQIVKRIVKVTLPKAIRNPAAVTSFKVGIAGEPTLKLTPVYLSGETITDIDKAFRPVLVKAVWWSPINIGQTAISKLNDPSSAGGNLFQWGRKQPLTWDSQQTPGPVMSAEAAKTDFIIANTSTNDWLIVQDNGLWNSGTDATPTKTNNDPCPVGWCVPSETEVNRSIAGSHTWAAASSPSASKNGLLTISGVSGNDLYFPAAGYLNNMGSVYYQGTYGYYWVSAVNGLFARFVYFNSATVNVSNNFRAFGMPVRCVQDR